MSLYSVSTEEIQKVNQDLKTNISAVGEIPTEISKDNELTFEE